MQLPAALKAAACWPLGYLLRRLSCSSSVRWPAPGVCTEIGCASFMLSCCSRCSQLAAPRLRPCTPVSLRCPHSRPLLSTAAGAVSPAHAAPPLLPGCFCCAACSSSALRCQSCCSLAVRQSQTAGAVPLPPTATALPNAPASPASQAAYLRHLLLKLIGLHTPLFHNLLAHHRHVGRCDRPRRGLRGQEHGLVLQCSCATISRGAPPRRSVGHVPSDG